MGRSLKKGPFVDPKLWAKVQKMSEKGEQRAIKTWARSCTIIPDFVGWTFLVHNGRAFPRVRIREDMVGHKLGEFSPTRSFRSHSKKEKRGR